MERLLTFALIVVLFLAAAVIAYTFITNKIIEDQDKEIEDLKSENKRLKKYIDCLNYAARSGRNISPVDTESITFTLINPEGKKVLEDLFKEW